MSDRRAETTPPGWLLPVSGCGRCADLVAAHLLTGAFYERLEEHLSDHEYEPSIWGEVNELAEATRV